MDDSPPKLFEQPLKAINIGLEMFAESLRAGGAEVVHVKWQPPAGGDARLADILASLDD